MNNSKFVKNDVCLLSSLTPLAERNVHFARCTAAISMLLKGCGLQEDTLDARIVRGTNTTVFQEHYAPVSYFLDFASGYCTKIKELATSADSVEVC
jgi:hypothetical protein